MRKRIYEVIEVAKENDRWSNIYDIIMMAAIVISIVPLAFKTSNVVFVWVDYITVALFIIDYVLRLLTADYKIEKGKFSFIIYPITPMAVIDLLSILPSLSMLNSTFKLLKLFRLLRTFRVLRAFKFMRYSKSFEIIISVFKKERKILCAVGTLAGAYILVSALIVFNIEPQTFKTFFDAIYWATVSLTTVGYGDIYPVTTIGRFITMTSSVFGVAIIALPAGIITAGYMNELRNK